MMMQGSAEEKVVEELKDLKVKFERCKEVRDKALLALKYRGKPDKKVLEIVGRLKDIEDSLSVSVQQMKYDKHQYFESTQEQTQAHLSSVLKSLNDFEPDFSEIQSALQQIWKMDLLLKKVPLALHPQNQQKISTANKIINLIKFGKDKSREASVQTDKMPIEDEYCRMRDDIGELKDQVYE